MELEAWKLLFRISEQVSSLELGLCLQIDTHSKNHNGANMLTNKKHIHMGGHVCGFKLSLDR